MINTHTIVLCTDTQLLYKVKLESLSGTACSSCHAYMFKSGINPTWSGQMEIGRPQTLTGTLQNSWPGSTTKAQSRWIQYCHLDIQDTSIGARHCKPSFKAFTIGIRYSVGSGSRFSVHLGYIRSFDGFHSDLQVRDNASKWLIMEKKTTLKAKCLEIYVSLLGIKCQRREPTIYS